MSTRSELKENILASKVEVLLQWVLANRSQVLTGLGVSVAALLIGSVFVLRNREQANQAHTQLAIVHSFIGARQYDRAEGLLSSMRTNLTANQLISQVAYDQGLAALGLKKFDEAEKFFVEAIDRSSASPLKPLALSNLGYTQEQKKDFNAAAQTYGRFMAEFGEHFLAPRVQLMLGRTLAMAGKMDEARAALGHLVDLYPTSPWAENARRIMDKLKTR